MIIYLPKIVVPKNQFDFHLQFISQRLSADQKEAYKLKAKAQPARVVVVPAKYTSQGISLEVVDREQRELAEKEKYMERTVNSIVEESFLENGKQSCDGEYFSCLA